MSDYFPSSSAGSINSSESGEFSTPKLSILRQHLKDIQVKPTSNTSLFLRIVSTIPGTIGLSLVGGFCKKAIDNQTFFPNWLGYFGWGIGSLIPITLASRSALNFWRMLYRIMPKQLKGENALELVKIYLNQLWNLNSISYNSNVSTILSILLTLTGFGACYYATAASAFGIFNMLKYLGFDTSSFLATLILSASQFSSFTTNFTLFLQVCAHPLSAYSDRLINIIKLAFTSNDEKAQNLLDAKAHKLIIDAILSDYIAKLGTVNNTIILKEHFRQLNQQLDPNHQDISDYLLRILTFWQTHILGAMPREQQITYLNNLFEKVHGHVKKSFSPLDLLSSFAKYSGYFLIGGSYALPNLEAGDEAGNFATQKLYSPPIWIPNFLNGAFSAGAFSNISLIGICSFLANAPITTRSCSLLLNLHEKLKALASLSPYALVKGLVYGGLPALNIFYAATQVGYAIVFTPTAVQFNSVFENIFYGVVGISAFGLGLFSDVNFIQAIANYFIGQKAVKAAGINHTAPSEIELARYRLLPRHSVASSNPDSRTNSLAMADSRNSSVSEAPANQANNIRGNDTGLEVTIISSEDATTLETTSLLHLNNGSPINTPEEENSFTKTLAIEASCAQSTFLGYNDFVAGAIYNKLAAQISALPTQCSAVNLPARGWQFFKTRDWDRDTVIPNTPWTGSGQAYLSM